MKYYLLDASAFIWAIENLDKIKLNFFVEKAKGEAFLYIPQFCITEVLNVFARFFYREKRVENRLYTKWKNDFVAATHNRKIVYCYDLHRYHNINTKTIIKLEHITPYKKGESSLSSFDILIIAMGMELKKIHSPNEVQLLTRDCRLQRISNMNIQFAKAIWFE